MNWNHLLKQSAAPRHLIASALVTLAAIAAIGLIATKRAASIETPPAAPERGSFHPTPQQWAALKVAEVKTLAFQSTVVTDGSIAFNDDATTPVFSPYSGRVTRLIAKLGDSVAQGAPLFAIAASEFVQSASDVAAAKAVRDTALATEKRQHGLYDAGAVAEKDWRQAQSDLTAAESVWAAARGRLKILGNSDADIDSLERVANTTAETIVPAPIAGTVIQRQVGIGQYISSAASGAANPVYTIGDVATVWLIANVRETDAPALHVGQEAEVTLPALPQQRFKARIAWVGAAVDAGTHRLPVRAELRNPGGLLKPQMFAQFTIATSAPHNAPAVPQSALVYEGETARVYVATDANTIVSRNVDTGRNHGGMVEIRNGLRPGEKIVTAGTLFIDRAAEGQ